VNPYESPACCEVESRCSAKVALLALAAMFFGGGLVIALPVAIGIAETVGYGELSDAVHFSGLAVVCLAFFPLAISDRFEWPRETAEVME
jgi:hypothetical protein